MYTTRKRRGFTLQQLAIVVAIIVVAIVVALVLWPKPVPSIDESSYRPYPGKSLEYSDTVKLNFQVHYKKTKEIINADIFAGKSPDSLELVAEKVEGVLSSTAEALFDFSYDLKVDPHSTYWWKVKVYNSRGKYDETKDPISFTLRNSEPEAPNLLTPGRNTEVHLDNIQFSWTKAEDADHDSIVYDLYITSDLRGDRVVYSRKGLTVNSFNLNGIDKLEFGETYYWHVVAKDGYGAEVSSTTGSFKTEPKPVPELSLITPINEEVDASTPVAFAWKQTNERYYWPLDYNFILRKGSEIVYEEKTSETTLTVANLTGHTKYSWFVTTLDKDGKLVESEKASFVTINHNPEVQIIEPARGYVTTEATITWKASDLENDPLFYDVYLIRNGVEEKLASNLEDTFYLVKGLESATEYTFKVVARDAFGGEGNATVTVFVGNNPPVVELLTPSATEAVNPLEVKFSWKAEDPDGDDVISYQLVIIDPSGAEIQAPVNSPTYTVEKLKSRTAYRWHVEAVDDKGAKGKSDEWTFVTSNNEPIPAVATLPEKDATDVAFDPGIAMEFVSSDPDGDPLSYVLEVSRDSSFTELVARKEGEVSKEGVTRVLVEGAFETNSTYFWRVITNDGAATATSDTWSFSTFDLPPIIEEIGVKEDDGVVNPIGATFFWSYYDTDDIVAEIEIHLKPELGEEKVVFAGINTNEYSLDFVLSPDSTYTYWIVVKDPAGKEARSEVKSFKTGNNPPVISFEFNELEHYGATTPVVFHWDVSDPEGSDVLVKVYFGMNKNAWEESPVATGVNLFEYRYEGTLNPEESYYFWLEAEDAQGNTAKLESPVLITPASTKLVYIAPEDKSLFDGKSPFIWSYSGEATPVNYILRVFNENGDTIFERSTDGDSLVSADDLELRGNRNYFWRVVAELPDTTKEVGKLYSFMAPDVPTRIASPTPADGMTGVDTENIILSWEFEDPDSDVITFDLYLEDSPVATGLTTSYATLTDYVDLESNNIYNWYVVAIDEFDNKITSNRWTFTTLNHSPVVSLLEPSNNATDLTDGIRLSWQGEDPDEEVLYYTVYLGTAEDLDEENIVLASATDTSYVFSSYKGNSTYYWKVQVRDEHGGIANSDVWSFSTGNASPKNAIILSPEVNATNVALRPVLEWQGEDPDGDTLEYAIYLGETPDVMTKIASTTETHVQIEGILDGNKTYYWKVDSYDGKGGFSESTVASFTTIGVVDRIAYVENGALKLAVFTEDSQSQVFTLVPSDISGNVKPVVFGNTVYAFRTDGTIVAVKIGQKIKEIKGDRYNNPETFEISGNALYIVSTSRFGKSLYRLSLQEDGLPGRQVELFRNGRIVSAADLAVSEDASSILIADTLYGLIILKWDGTRYSDTTPENFVDLVKGIANSAVIKDGVAFIGITGFGGGISFVSLDNMESLVPINGYYLATEMVLVGNTLYAVTDKGLSIIDVRDPSNPKVIDDVKISGRLLSITVGGSGKVLLLSTDQGLKFFDIETGKIM
ncbi:fibronectin type III domain-containing protein [Kosmotoga pacifica]|uniref:Fibronectin type-III domain-containing protein n=1 Tax=Kosmotoga pacifica TaxID=1330330 RepID=A0A0G2Z5M8_9BACT|nr:fibronectin type III domain-containing protein [Kosmotoga pacifica]AKI96920.1 hypothetical protein IX53_02765 [Kosmotoga pacifica]